MNKSNIVFIHLIIIVLFLSNLIIGCGDSKSESKQTLEDKLFAAAQFGNFEEVQQLLEKGANPYLVFDGHGRYASTLLAVVVNTELILKLKDSPLSTKESRAFIKKMEKNGATVEKLKKTWHVLMKWQREHPGEYHNPYSKPLILDINPKTERSLLHIGPTPSNYPREQVVKGPELTELDAKDLAEILKGIENVVNNNNFSLINSESISNSGVRLVMTTSDLANVFKLVSEFEKCSLFEKVNLIYSRNDEAKLKFEIEFHFTEQTKDEQIRTEELRSLKEKIST